MEDEQLGTFETIKPWYARPKFVFPLAALALIVGFAAIFMDIPSFLAGETDIWGNYRFIEEMREAEAGRTPIERVHAQLFPSWFVAAASGTSGGASSPAAESAFEELAGAVEDPELSDILKALREVMRADDLVARATEVNDLSDRWNQRLAELKLPFYGDIHVTSAADRAFVVGIFYRRLQMSTLKIRAEEGQPTAVDSALMQRFDSTNLVEAYLGQAQDGRDFAILIVDRIVDFVASGVWPILADEAPKALGELEIAFAPAVRAEIRAALGPETYAALTQAADHHQKLGETVDAIHARKRCGNRFRIAAIPYFGFDPLALRQLEEQAGAQKIQPCPTVTQDEARAMRRHSRALQTAEIRDAIAQLVAWISKPIALHEVQHIVDRAWMDTHQLDELPCPGCDPLPSPLTRLEISAYLASFAHAPNPATALLQACLGSAGSGVHTRAMLTITQHLEHRCTDGPLEELPARAHQLHQALFDYSPTIQLPADYPDTLDLSGF